MISNIPHTRLIEPAIRSGIIDASTTDFAVDSIKTVAVSTLYLFKGSSKSYSSMNISTNPFAIAEPLTFSN